MTVQLERRAREMSKVAGFEIRKEQQSRDTALLRDPLSACGHRPKITARQSIAHPEELKKLPAPLFSAKKRIYEAPERQAEGKAMGET